MGRDIGRPYLTSTPRDGGLGGGESIIITWWIKAREISETPTSRLWGAYSHILPKQISPLWKRGVRGDLVLGACVKSEKTMEPLAKFIKIASYFDSFPF
jgi:hypothetical protein